jgi:hypothetical protein
MKTAKGKQGVLPKEYGPLYSGVEDVLKLLEKKYKPTNQRLHDTMDEWIKKGRCDIILTRRLICLHLILLQATSKQRWTSWFLRTKRPD